jgi:hypothetical protein
MIQITIIMTNVRMDTVILLQFLILKCRLFVDCLCINDAEKFV